MARSAWLLAFWLSLRASLLVAQTPAASQADLVQVLRNRVAADPANATNWRLLGKTLEIRGDLAGALDAFHQAVSHDAESAAGHADLARMLAATGQTDRAIEHWYYVLQLAPESDYARQAAAQLQSMPDVVAGTPATPASFEVDWLDAMEPELGAPAEEVEPLPASPWFWKIETGALYNSNVQLAPISRELNPEDPSSFQAYVAPEFEHRFFRGEVWQAGSLFRGYFNFNEDDFRQFNLQHLEPGLFVERPIWFERFDLVPRLEYDFAYDAFDGNTLGLRHALLASLNAYTRAGRTYTLYWTVDNTDFRDDGSDPGVTSLDGWSQTLGASHGLQTGWRALTAVRVGADFQLADLEGSTYSYRGPIAYVDGELAFPLGCQLLLQGAWGYREYPDFEFAPSRNEFIYRAGVELKKQLSAYWSISGNYVYDRFASENEAFDASRWTSGLFTTFQR